MITPDSLFPFLDPEAIIQNAGPWAVLVVCIIIFVETGLLVGFFLPGDTLLLFTGLFALHPGIGMNVFLVATLIALSAIAGDALGYWIGRKIGPPIFERKESGLFSRQNVIRTSKFFDRWGGLAIVLARFVPIVRTFAPVAAGVGKMHYGKYTTFNIIGAAIWSYGLVLLGYVLIPFTDWLGIPWFGIFVREYIDLILLLAITLSLLPVIWHFISGAIKRRRSPQPEISDEEIRASLWIDEEAKENN